MGYKEQETFYNRKEQLVQWQFINVSELYLLNELIDGAEFIQELKKKKMQMLTSIRLIKKLQIFSLTIPAIVAVGIKLIDSLFDCLIAGLK